MHRCVMPALLAASALLAVAYAPLADDSPLPDAPASAVVQPPTMTLIAATSVVDAEQPHISLTFEVSNPNDASLMYTGYLPTSFDPPLDPASFSPMYEIEVQRDSQWQDHFIGWCGTGMGNLELKPNSPVAFSVAVPDDGWTAIRVGFGHDPGWSEEEAATTTSTRWSTIVWREEIAASVSGM